MIPKSSPSAQARQTLPAQNSSFIVTKDSKGDISIKEFAGAWYQRFGQILKTFFFESKGCKVYFLNKSIARITIKFIDQTVGDHKDIIKIQQTSSKVASLKGRISAPLTEKIEQVEKEKLQFDEWEKNAAALFAIENDQDKYLKSFLSLYSKLYPDLGKPIREKIVGHLLTKLTADGDLDRILKLIKDPRLSVEDKKTIAKHFLPALKQTKMKEQEQLITELKGFGVTRQKLADEMSLLEKERGSLKEKSDPAFHDLLPKLSLPARSAPGLAKYTEGLLALREALESNRDIGSIVIPEGLAADLETALKQAQEYREILIKKKEEFKEENYLGDLAVKKEELARLLKDDDLGLIAKHLLKPGTEATEDTVLDAIYDESISEEQLEAALRLFEKSHATLIGNVKADSSLTHKQQLQLALRLIIENRHERTERLKKEVKTDDLQFPGFYEMGLADAEAMLKDYVEKHQLTAEMPNREDLIKKLRTLQPNSKSHIELRKEARAILELSAAVKEKRANAESRQLIEKQATEAEIVAGSLQELTEALGQLKAFQEKKARLGEIEESLLRKAGQQNIEGQEETRLQQKSARLGEQLGKIIKLEAHEGSLDDYLSAMSA